MSAMPAVQVEKEVSPRFEDFLFEWRYKYQLLVGGYGSSKSYHAALKVVFKLLSEKRTALVVREVYETHKDSTFALFVEIIDELGLLDSSGRRKIARGKIKAKESPYELRFSNGSKIIFKGMDKPEKLKSIHNVSLVWLEECSEIKYEGFKELMGRLRHPTLGLYMILTTNPVAEENWTYTHFFKDELNETFVLDDQELYEKGTVVVGDTYYHHSTAEDNPFLPDDYLEQLEDMKNYDPDLYRVARKGHFGVSGTRVLPQFEVKPHRDVIKALNHISNPIKRVGMDFGFEDSYNAVIRMAVDPDRKYLYIYWEYYKKGMTDDKTEKELKAEGLRNEKIIADSAEPKTIQYYRQQGFDMQGARKYRGSRLENTKKVKRFRKIICSDVCKNAIRELKTLTYKKDKQGKTIYDEFNLDAHTFEAIWYGLDGYEVADLKEEAQTRARPTRQRPAGRRR